MKQTLLVAIASAAIGAATAVLLTPRSMPVARGPAPARLSTVDIEVAFVRALESAGIARRVREAPVRAEVEPSSAPLAHRRIPDESATPIRSVSGREVLPERNLPELQGLLGFRRDPVLRREWMFRPERDVMAWLGAPDRAWVVGGGESWVYELPNGTKRVLEFHRGRLLNIQG